MTKNFVPVSQRPGTFAERADARDAQELQEAGSLKWTAFQPADGAWVAESDFGLAAPVRKAVVDFIDKEMTGYASMNMRKELKVATAQWLDKRYGWSVPAERVHWLPDVLTGLTMMLSYLVPDGKVIVPTPCYMPFVDIPGVCGRELIQVPMIQTEDSWEFDFESIDQAFKDGGNVLILCNPHNPIGKVVTAGEMDKITKIVDAHNGWVFSDEIHAPLVLDGNHVPYASTSQSAAQHTVTALSASKAFNTAGLKCAQLVVTNDEQQRWMTSQGHGIIHESAPIGVVAAISAYRDGEEWLDDLVDYLRGNRDYLVEAVEKKLPGVKMIAPQSTFLAWLDVRGLGLEDPRQHFLKAGVALTDGAECGDVGKGWLRLCFGTPRPVLEQIIEKMAAALA